MKKSRHQFRYTGTVLLVLLVLVLVIGSFSVWNYLRVNSITESLAAREAEGLVYQVERELENAAISESVTLNLVADHLYSAAYMARRMIYENEEKLRHLDVLSADAGIHSLEIFDKQNRFLASNSGKQSVPIELVERVNDLYNDQGLAEFTVGFYQEKDTEKRNFAVSVDYLYGGLLIAAYDAADLMAWREELGFGSIIKHLENHPEVRYAMMISENGVLAATSNLQEWITQDDLVGITTFEDSLTFKSGFVERSPGEVFEVTKALTILDDVWLIVGLASDEITQIRARNVNSLLLRSVLFLVLSAVTIGMILLRQSQKLLIRESDRIKRELESLEADKRASERLEAMGKLAGGVAHEIRNPLNTVGMVAQRLALEFDPKEDREEYLALVKTMRSETGRISKIVQDFLNFARPPKAKKSKTSLDPLVEKMKTLFETVASKKGCEFRLDHQASKEYMFDEAQVTQAVQNLLRNAFEAVEDGSGVVELETRENGQFIEIEVKDNGPGIPEEERVRIFHLYYTTKAEGTGIGLSLVHRIADEHAGRVLVDDAPGGGASITLQLKK
jgi:signal transduction histidine kinase